MLIARPRHLRHLEALLGRNHVVAIVGARQVGKTTLARELMRRRRGPASFFDLEDPRDVALLAEPMLALAPLRGLVILDEIQRRPELFPVLRVLADRPRGARFLVLGSASPGLLRQSSESLAGRIAYYELPGFGVDEVPRHMERLWLRGGFPSSFVAPSDRASAAWRRELVRTFLERDIPQLGVSIPSSSLSRFWSMLAHVHGQTLNWSELGRSLGVADTTVRRYLDLLAGTFMVRQLLPWHENLSKRQVKSPKIYLADSGMLHTLLGIESRTDLDRHPKLGASFEGFCLMQLVAHLGARWEECHFWATHAGAELDLLVVRGHRRRGFELKRSDAPSLTASMRIALEDLRLDSLEVIYPGERTYALGKRVRAIPLSRLLSDVKPL